MNLSNFFLILLFCDAFSHYCSEAPEEVETNTDQNLPDEEIVEEDDEDECDEESEDAEEAFNDLEDEHVLCSDYVSEPRTQKYPDAIVIGVRKGGTRALLEFANMHSKVLRAKPEIHYFDKSWDKGLSWYISKMPPVLPGQICLEKTPGYFHTAGVPQRIHQTNNSTKLVLIVRNPVDRMISDYNQFRANQINKGKGEYPPLEHFLFTSSGNINIGYQPLQRSIYHYHLVRWMRYFPLDQILVVDGDKFIKEPWTGLSELEKFLGLEPEIGRHNFFFNKTKGFHCGLQTISLPTSSNHAWSCTRKTCLSKSKGRPKAPVERETLIKLTRFYAPHNDIFFNLIGRHDFDWPDTWQEESEEETEEEEEEEGT